MRPLIGTCAAAALAAVATGDPAAIGCAAVSMIGSLGLGVAFPALGVFGPVLSRSGAAADGTLALTFDDGPNARFTPRVIDALGRLGHRATFFLVGESVARHPDVARAIRDAGHGIGLHSNVHSPWNALYGRDRLRADFQAAERTFEDALGLRPSLYRPPVGLVNPRVMAVARERGYRVVAWTVRALDGVRFWTPGTVRARVRAAAAGDVVLMHDALHGRPDEVPPGVLALPGILADLGARGLRSVTIA